MTSEVITAQGITPRKVASGYHFLRISNFQVSAFTK